MDKRAQFFLLAAVIIAAIVISLGITANQARVSYEPGSFYDYTYEVKREVGAVIDYEIYTDIVGGDLDDFVQILANDIKDKDPEANFMFAYGNSDGMVLSNYGVEEVITSVDDEPVEGSGKEVTSTICIGNKCSEVSNSKKDFNEGSGVKIVTMEEMEGEENIEINMKGNHFSFPISKHKQVIFIIQKDVNDETFIAAE